MLQITQHLLYQLHSIAVQITYRKISKLIFNPWPCEIVHTQGRERNKVLAYHNLYLEIPVIDKPERSTSSFCIIAYKIFMHHGKSFLRTPHGYSIDIAGENKAFSYGFC